MAGTGDPVSPQACGRKAAVFDGRMRFDLHSEFKRMETVKAEKGYQGPVVVCAVYFTPISGYNPERYAIRYLTGLRDAEVWLAPISGTRVLVPYRFSTADADRHRRSAGDRIRLGAETAACRGRHENAVIWKDCGCGADFRIPVIHRSASLDSSQKSYRRRALIFWTENRDRTEMANTRSGIADMRPRHMSR